MKVVALVPAYNEADRIGATLNSLLQIESLTKIVVISDGSTDETVATVREFPVELIDLPHNLGKGQALNVAWEHNYADIYLLIDADLQDSAIHAKELIKPVLNRDADMTIANFAFGQTGDKNLKMGLGIAKRFASWGIKFLTGYSVVSPLSGQRAVCRQILEKSGGFAKDFGVEVGLTISALNNGFRLMEISLPMTHRATGRGLAGFIHRGKQLWTITKVLAEAWRNR